MRLFFLLFFSPLRKGQEISSHKLHSELLLAIIFLFLIISCDNLNSIFDDLYSQFATKRKNAVPKKEGGGPVKQSLCGLIIMRHHAICRAST